MVTRKYEVSRSCVYTLHFKIPWLGLKGLYHYYLWFKPIVDTLNANDKVVCDVGTGPGIFLMLNSKGIRYGVGVDASLNMIVFAHRVIKTKNR